MLMLKLFRKSRGSKAEDGDDATPEDPVVVALRAQRRMGFVFGFLVCLLLAGALVLQYEQLRVQRARMDGFVTRLATTMSRIDDRLARLQDQSARAGAGIDLLRGNVAQVQDQIDRLNRALPNR